MLPAPDALFGREADLARVQNLLDTHALVTLVGPDGIGKTALAEAVAAAQPPGRGRWLVRLSALTTLDDTLAAVASVLHLPTAAVASPAALTRAMRPLELLLVLDGAERLRDALAAMVAPWPHDAPGMRVLVTSRQPLGLPGEQVVHVEPLPAPAAAALFRHRLGVPAAEPGRAGPDRVDELCRLLGGVPLALELAAAQARAGGTAALHDELRVAVAGTADPLAALIEWAYGRLDGEAQAVLRGLAVFEGPFSAELALAVCGGSAARVAAFARLQQQGWTRSNETGQRQLPAAVREVATRHLADAGEAEARRAAHLAAMLEVWRDLFDRCYADPILQWGQRARAHLDNLRQALRYAGTRKAHAAAAIELLGCTPLVWSRLGLRVEGRQWCDRLRPLLDAAPAPAPVLQAAYWLTVAAQGVFAFQYNDVETRNALSRALPVLRNGRDVWRTTLALYLEVMLIDRAGRAREGQALVDEMTALEPASWSWTRRQLRRSVQALVDRASGRVGDYLAYCRSELAEHRRLGQHAEAWTAAHHLALAEQDAGRPEAAIAALDEAHGEIRALGAQRQFATLIALRATMVAEQGEPARIDAALDEALPVLQAAGTAWMLDDAWAWRAVHGERFADAARLVGRADRALTVRGSAKRSAYLQRSYQALRNRIDAALGAAEAQRLMAAGERLDSDSAFALARKR